MTQHFRFEDTKRIMSPEKCRVFGETGPRPLNEIEAGVDLVLVETSLPWYVNDAVLMLISRNLHRKSIEVSTKTRSTPASLNSEGQAIKHATS